MRAGPLKAGDSIGMLQRLSVWLEAAATYVRPLQPDAAYFEDWLIGLKWACEALGRGPCCTEEAVHALAQQARIIIGQVEDRAARQVERLVARDREVFP